jgi:hypothetical protein
MTDSLRANRLVELARVARALFGSARSALGSDKLVLFNTYRRLNAVFGPCDNARGPRVSLLAAR